MSSEDQPNDGRPCWIITLRVVVTAGLKCVGIVTKHLYAVPGLGSSRIKVPRDNNREEVD